MEETPMTETDDIYTRQNSAESAGDNAPYMTIGELSKRVKATVEGAFDYVRVLSLIHI